MKTNPENSPKFTTIHHNLPKIRKGAPRIFYFHILRIAEFGYIYFFEGLPLEQHKKIEKKKNNTTSYLIDILIYIYMASLDARSIL